MITAAEVTSGTDRGRIALALTMPLALALGLAALLLQTVHPQSPDSIERYEDVTPLPPLRPTEVVSQTVTARDDGQLHVIARFGTFKGSAECTVVVKARRADGREVSRRTLDCEDLRDNELAEVATAPEEAVARGDVITVTFTAERAGDQSVALWAGEAEDVRRAQMGADELDASVELYTRYGDRERLIDRLGSVLSRAQQYRAWWGAPGVIALLVVVMVGGLAALPFAPARRRVPILLLVVAAKGTFWSVLLPPLETPDEPAHFAYAQYMAEERAIPDRYEQRGGRRPFSDQLRAAIEVVHQPLLNPGDRPDFGPGPDGPDEGAPDRASPRSGGGGNPAAGYAPPYFAGAAVAYALPPSSFFTTLSTMRLWSVALGVGAIWLVVGIGRRALHDEAGALALGVAVAFQPVWTQATAAVNNDAAVVVAGAACTVVALDLALRPDRSRLPLIAGLVYGGALLTKPFAAAFAVPLALGWLLGVGRRGRGGQGWLRDVRDAAAGVAATFGTWLVLSRLLGIPTVTTDDAGIAPGTRTVRDYLSGVAEDGFQTLHLNWVNRLWGNLSWTDTPPPDIVDNVVARITIAVLALGMVWLLLTGRDVLRHRRRTWPVELGRDATAVAVLGSGVVVTIAMLHLIELRYFLRTGNADLLAGRYLMMLLPAILGVIPLLVRRVAPRIPVTVTMTGLAVGVMALHAVAIDTMLDHFYL